MTNAEKTTPKAPPGKRPMGALPGVLGLFLAFACAYMVARAVFILRADYGWGDIALAVGLLLGELFAVVHAVAYSLEVVASSKGEQRAKAEIDDWSQAPSVALLMPARHEPKDVLEATLTTLENLDYPNKTIYFLDDSSDERYKREAEELAQAHGAVLFRRTERHGAKAGVINDRVRGLTEKYVAVFDADQNPMPHFLKETVALLEANPRLALVQTPQFYTNTDASAVALGANLQNGIFYEYICEGKSARGAMICCGTNMVMRREALDDIGGFDEGSITEDFATTIDFHARQWETMYFPHAYVFGSGPETLSAYLKQQWRWSRGNLGVLKKVLLRLLTHPLSLGPWQWWEHLVTGTYFLVGWAYFFLLICPIAYVLFGTPSFFMSAEVYLPLFVPYFCLSLSMFYASMRRRNYRFIDMAKCWALLFVCVPVYMQAAIGALFNLEAGFSVTEKGKGAATPLRVIWPQVVLWLANFAALVWGANRLAFEFDASVAASMVWILYHFIGVTFVFYFRLPPREPAALGEAA